MNIKDTDAAYQLAELVLDMGMGTNKGLAARSLARKVLGIEDRGNVANLTLICTNGTARLIPKDEPVFLIRGQDAVGGAAVRAWIELAHAYGAAPAILDAAREHADKMDAWPKKKRPDLKGDEP